MMRWSYSASRTFRKCQRQWYFKNVVANGRAKEPVRRRAYLLSKLQTVSAWRGQIVDDVISKVIVPGVNRRSPVMLSDAKALARDRYERQLEFALRHPINDPDLRVGEEGDEFCLLYGMEYGSPPSEDELEQAWREVEQALANLYSMDAVRSALKTSEYVIAQRPLQVPLIEGVTTISYPDVIAFRKAEPPIIIDWKVHVFGENDAWLQLAIYAMALSRSKHKDFPADFGCTPDHVRLLEVQLLTGLVREHRLDVDQMEDAEEYAVDSAYEMYCLVDERKNVDVDAEDFLPAVSAETCQTCQFRSLCWEKVNAH
jgi:hypothetical protein